MQVMFFGLPDGVPSLKLPEGRRSIRLARCGQTLRKARILSSASRQTMTGSRAIDMVRKS